MLDNSNSVACQTDWSWLAAYRAIKDKLPQESSSSGMMLQLMLTLSCLND